MYHKSLQKKKNNNTSNTRSILIEVIQNTCSFDKKNFLFHENILNIPQQIDQKYTIFIIIANGEDEAIAATSAIVVRETRRVSPDISIAAYLIVLSSHKSLNRSRKRLAMGTRMRPVSFTYAFYNFFLGDLSFDTIFVGTRNRRDRINGGQGLSGFASVFWTDWTKTGKGSRIPSEQW